MSCASCCTFCSGMSFLGVVFFTITSIQIMRENNTFLSHKAGLNLHYMTDEELNGVYDATFMAAIVSNTDKLLTNILFHRQCS
jgi:hypothetical protein